MENIFIENITFFIFLFLLIFFLIYNKKNFSIQGKFPTLYILLYETQIGIKWMKNLAKNYPKTIRVFSWVSLVIGIIGIFLSLAVMIWQLGFIYDNQIEQGAALVLPIKTQDNNLGGIPVLSLDFIDWIIALAILIFVHEFAHGVVSKRQKIKIKSSGLAFFGSAIIGLLVIFFNQNILGFIIGLILMFVPILPGAFVKPDEKKLKKADDFTKISIYGAGSTSNFLFAGIFLLIFLAVLPIQNSLSNFEGYSFSNVSNNSDLLNYNISNGTIIKVDGLNETKNLIFFLQNKKVNDKINLTILSNENIEKKVEINLYENEITKKPMVGVFGLVPKIIPKKSYEIYYEIIKKIISILFWIWFLNLMIGFVNLLPIWITDGGQIFLTLCERFFNKNIAGIIYNFISLLVLLIIILTMFPNLLYLIF